jgi:hypothetical protein
VQSNGCSRSQTRTFSATDGCGNSATASTSVTWTSDPTPPAFTGNYNNVTLGCNPADITTSLGSASATDGCGIPTITSSDGAVTSNGCDRSQVRTFTCSWTLVVTQLLLQELLTGLLTRHHQHLPVTILM